MGTLNNGYQAYQIYQSLKLHFTTDYDAVKYNYKTSVKQSSFERRRDRLRQEDFGIPLFA